MSQRQLQRWNIVRLVEGRKVTLKEASEKMGASHRQAKHEFSIIECLEILN